MNRPPLSNNNGFGLVELLVLLIVVSILIAVAMQTMTATMSDYRRVKTELEMATLATAITGDPEKMADGARTDFGYVGDNGAFPPDLNALRTNPGLGTWDGPYLPPDIIEDSLGYKTDEWGQAYAYSGGTTIQSTGSGSTLTREVARSTSDYLLNQLSGIVVDSNGTPPGAELDSIALIVTVPNGAGSYSNKAYHPDSTGQFTLDSLPVGHHRLEIIYAPANDTLHRFIHILPRHRSIVEYKFASAWFDTTSSGPSPLEYVPGTAYVTGVGSNCDQIGFDITNPGTVDINITSIKMTWAAPATYYKSVRIESANLFNSQMPRKGSNETVSFSSETIATGDTVTIRYLDFCENLSGNCSSKGDMAGVDFTVEFSDGSIISFNVGSCP